MDGVVRIEVTGGPGLGHDPSRDEPPGGDILAWIVADHGGRLFDESPPGRADRTIVLELPIAGEAPNPVPIVTGETGSDQPSGRPSDPAKPAEAAATSDARTQVVVLDDEPSIRAFLGKALRVGGFEAITTADGPAAVEAARDPMIAAVLCDHRMAGMSGLEVYEAIAATRPDLATRFVLMSGDILDPELRHFAETHGIRLLAKPFDIETINRTIRETIDGRTTDQRGAGG